MKKILVLSVLLLSFLVTFTGCSNKDTLNGVKYEVKSVEKSKTIDFGVGSYDGRFVFVTISATNETDKEVSIDSTNFLLADGKEESPVDNMLASLSNMALASDVKLPVKGDYLVFDKQIAAKKSEELVLLFPLNDKDTYESGKYKLTVQDDAKKEKIQLDVK